MIKRSILSLGKSYRYATKLFTIPDIQELCGSGISS